MMTAERKNILFIAVRAALTAGALIAGVSVLYRFGYFAADAVVDNFVGLLPVAFVLLGVGALTALVWLKHTKRLAPLSVALALLVVASVALFPNALRGNWWPRSDAAGGAADQPDLSVYAPFAENSQTAKLDGAPSLTLNSDLPRLDGATAFYPVYAAFAETVFARESYTPELVACSKTSKAFQAVIDGDCDVIFTLKPSAGQSAAAKKAGVDLWLTPIGREAFVFLAGGKNPVDNLSYAQIRNVYSGKTAKWSTLGWREGGDIIAFQRPDGSGSQTGLQSIMGDTPIQAPQPLPDDSLIGTNSLMKQVSVEWRGVQPALGYSYRYYATTMYPNPAAKMLKVDGVYPSPENIRNGAYPFVFDVYAVTNGEPRGNTQRLIDWILSPQGQELIKKSGYTPIAE